MLLAGKMATAEAARIPNFCATIHSVVGHAQRVTVGSTVPVPSVAGMWAFRLHEIHTYVQSRTDLSILCRLCNILSFMCSCMFMYSARL